MITLGNAGLLIRCTAQYTERCPAAAGSIAMLRHSVGQNSTVAWTSSVDLLNELLQAAAP